MSNPYEMEPPVSATPDTRDPNALPLATDEELRGGHRDPLAAAWWSTRATAPTA